MGLLQICGVDGSSGLVVAVVTLRSRGGPHDPECDCLEAEAPIQGRLQGPPLEGSLILQAVCCIWAIFLSCRDIEELFRERGLAVDRSSVVPPQDYQSTGHPGPL